MTFKEEMAEMGANVEKKLLSLMRKEEEEELETAVNFLDRQFSLTNTGREKVKTQLKYAWCLGFVSGSAVDHESLATMLAKAMLKDEITEQ
jgi:hypothetical protein